MRLLFSGLNAASGAGDTAFCGALRERAKVYFADARANCETVAPGNSGGTIHVGDSLQASSLIKQVRPSYPQEAKSRHITGTVKFEARIGKDGKIHDLEFNQRSFRSI